MSRFFAVAIATVCCCSAVAQTPRDLVQEAVNIEIATDRTDHSHWLYLEDYRSPDGHLRQWVAQTAQGNVTRLFEQNGHPIPLDQQHQSVDKFLHDSAAQARQRKNSNSDDQQSLEMMRILPTAFIWTEKSHTPTSTTLHFEPDPSFKPPTYPSRVFAAMGGDLTIENGHHRITALTGTMRRDVTFGGGLFGRVEKGGYFALQRQEVAPGQWQITATHIHVHGHILMFKTISDQEDDLMSKYQLQSPEITLQQAAALVFQQQVE